MRGPEPELKQPDPSPAPEGQPAEAKSPSPRVPENFKCPITHEVMVDPVIPEGSVHSYERSAIDEWFRQGRSEYRDPSTNEVLARRDEKAENKGMPKLLPNIALKNAIGEWKEEKQDAKSELKEGKRGAQVQPQEAKPTPPSFDCPITHDVMQDPVILKNGQTYERAAIEEWFDAQEQKQMREHGRYYTTYTDPLSNQPLNNPPTDPSRPILRSNRALKNAIHQDWGIPEIKADAKQEIKRDAKQEAKREVKEEPQIEGQMEGIPSPPPQPIRYGDAKAPNIAPPAVPRAEGQKAAPAIEPQYNYAPPNQPRPLSEPEIILIHARNISANMLKAIKLEEKINDLEEKSKTGTLTDKEKIESRRLTHERDELIKQAKNEFDRLPLEMQIKVFAASNENFKPEAKIKFFLSLEPDKQLNILKNLPQNACKEFLNNFKPEDFVQFMMNLNPIQAKECCRYFNQLEPKNQQAFLSLLLDKNYLRDNNLNEFEALKIAKQLYNSLKPNEQLKLTLNEDALGLLKSPPSATSSSYRSTTDQPKADEPQKQSSIKTPTPIRGA